MARFKEAPAPGDSSGLRRAFAERGRQLVDRLAAELDPESLQRALSAASDVGGLARALSVTADTAAEIDPLAPAFARGAAEKEALIERLGGLLSVEAVARLLGIKAASVDRQRRRGALLAVPLAGGGHGYPAAGFAAGRVLPGLDRVLQILRDVPPWQQLTLLATPRAALENRTGFEALADGDVNGVILVARESLADHV